MRRWLLLPVVLLATILLVSATIGDTEETTQTLKSGESVNKALATVTSTAISPLLGVSVMGAWQYWKTPKPQRANLPFFDKPYFWVPVIVLLVLIFIKDTFGGFAPLIKKPLDAIEVLLVNHASLVLIVFPVVMNQVGKVMGAPSLRSLFSQVFSGPVAYAATTQGPALHDRFTAFTAVLYVIVGFVITGVVWLLGHCFDILALISPFPFVDFLLKAIRNVIFAVLLVTSAISPHVGLLLALVVIVVSFLAVGWSLRLSFFGALYALSLLRMLLFDWRERPGRDSQVRAFSAGIKGASKRTYGRLLKREDGSLLFVYRRMLIGPEKSLAVGRTSSFSVGRGVFHPTIIEPIESAGKHRVVFRLLPTYRGAEEEVRAVLSFASVEDLRWTKGLASFWKFVSEGDEGTPEKL